MKHVRILQACAAFIMAAVFANPAVADTDRYIVQFKDRGASGGYRALAASGASVQLSLDSVNAAAVLIPQRALNGLRNNPNIEFIEPDPKRYPMSLQDSETVPYGIVTVEADLATNAGGMTVCIIDSGYDRGHPDLPNSASVTGDTGSAGNWFQDGSGHGTHVAGTIAALGNNGTGVVGVNPAGNLNLHIVRVFNDSGSFSYASGLVAALEDCETAGASVVNMSLGGSFKSRTEDRAFAAADGRGVLSIAAAGNDGNSRHSYPASYSSVVSVAAVDEDLNHASFSQTTSQVELAGPGVHVLSTVPRGTGSEGSANVGGTTYVGDAMDGSASGTAGGTLVDCGLGANTCPGGGGQVCLIQRGDISFAEKVAACEAGGGSAAIIYNNVAGPLLGTLGEQAAGIPAIGVSDADGDAMQAGLGGSATVTVAVSDYAFYDGTSMATPHVAGVAALVWSNHQDCTNQEIRNALTTTALDLGASGRDDLYGHGLVQAASAITYLDANGCGGGSGGGGGSDGGGGGGGGGKPCNPRKEVCN
jgi:subtilisin family serine protease